MYVCQNTLYCHVHLKNKIKKEKKERKRGRKERLIYGMTSPKASLSLSQPSRTKKTARKERPNVTTDSFGGWYFLL